MAQFDVGLDRAQEQAAALVTAIHGLGKSLDSAEFKSKGLAKEVAKAMTAMDKVYDTLHGHMIGAGDSVADVNKALEHAKAIAQGVFASIAAANLKATVQATAYNGELTQMNAVLNDTSAKNNFVKWQQKTAQLTANLINENKHLEAAYKSLDTEEGRRNATLKTQTTGLRNLITAEDRLINTHNGLQQTSALLDTALGKETANLRVQTAAKEQLITLDTRLRAESQMRQATMASLNTEEGRQNAILAVQEAHKRSLVTADAQLIASNSSLRAAAASLDGQLGKTNANLKVQGKAKADLVTFDARLKASTEEVTRVLGSLATAQGQEKVLTQAAADAKKSEITETTRLTAKLEGLHRHYESLNGGLREQIAVAEQLVRVRTAEITEAARESAAIEKLKRQHASLNGGLQEEIIKLTALNNQRKLVIAETVKEKVVVDEQAKALAREQAQLLKLQQQMSLMSSARGLEITKLKQQILEQEKYNRVLTMSTAQLLGFGAAQARTNSSNVLGSQSAAMLRASLGGLQANIGMYTSGTILAAAATYALARALKSTVTLGAEFTASMAKADAVMSTGLASWMPSDMGAMEMQVRALGQSTMYTASEVALGLVELGQAGLSSADSIMALKPALNLAMIGSLTMAQSADMATNVMMTFGMTAKDLTGIVDLMATAASQSNTNVEQLANALTYAGPAAHTAGISLKDTTAAIEALSNTGIKASRAGTGLRKLFVSLLNPTKKGQQMMDQYGISVTDMEGKTRGLTDILGQLNTALKDVGEGERLSAIQNLVGLYATSPVASLVGQAGEGGNLEHLRRQLDDVSGAAEEMRRKMENSLKFDWKQVISAFEEAQLQLFDAHEYQLRNATAKLSLYLIELTKPAQEIKDQYGNVTATFSELDLLLQNGKEAAQGLGIALISAMGFKFAGNASMALTALSVDSRAAATNLRVLAMGMADGTRGTLSLTGSLTAMRTTLLSNVAAVRALNAQVGFLGTTAVVAARSLSALAAAGGALMRVFGWVGLVYGIGSAIYAAFGQDSQAEILKQQAGVKDLKTEYDSLKNSIDATAKARERAAMVGQQDAELTKLGKINERKYVVEDAVNTYKNAGLAVPQSLKDELYDVEAAASRAAAAIRDAGVEIQKMDDPGAKMKVVEQDLQRAGALAELEKTAAEAKQAYDDAEGRMRLKQQDAWRTAQEAVDAFKASLVVATQQSDVAAAQAASAIDLMARLRDEQMSAMSAYSFEKNATSAQKLLDIQNQMVTAETEMSKASGLGQGDVVERKAKDLLDLKKKEFDLKKEVLGTTVAYKEAKDALVDFSATDSERLAKAKQGLADLEASKGKVTYGSEGLEAEAGVKTAKRELELRQQIKQIETSMASQSKKDNKKPAKTDSTKELEAAITAYDRLAKKIDPVTAAQRELEKGTASMDVLLANNKITIEQYRLAMGELNLAYYDAKKGLDLNAVALEKVKDSYNTSPFSQTAADLGVLNRALEDGKVSLEDYVRITDRMKKSQTDALKSSLPKANLQVGDASDSPFTDWVSTELERAKGLEDYRKAQENLKFETVDAGAGIDDKFSKELEMLNARKLLEQGAEKEHTEKLLEINKNYQAEKEALVKTSGDAQMTITTEQMKYTEQMGTMALMAAMNSVSNVLGMFASAADGASTAQKLAFVAQKAITVAQIIMYTELAAAQAMAMSGNPMVLGIPMATFIRATGYANAALVGAMAVGELAGGGKSSSGGGTEMYDTGGTIPYNRVGIVGEYGPELVSGPAHVTGRGASGSRLGGDSGNSFEITLAPQIHISSDGGGGGTPDDQAKSAKLMADTVKATVMSVLSDQMRPNGVIDTFVKRS